MCIPSRKIHVSKLGSCHCSSDTVAQSPGKEVHDAVTNETSGKAEDGMELEETGDDGSMGLVEIDPNLTKETFDCENCSKTFKNKHHFSRHNLSVHSGIRISCDDFGKTFTRQDKLSEHKRVLHLNC